MTTAAHIEALAAEYRFRYAFGERGVDIVADWTRWDLPGIIEALDLVRVQYATEELAYFCARGGLVN